MEPLYWVALASLLVTAVIATLITAGWGGARYEARIMCALMLPGIAVNLGLLVRRVVITYLL